MAKFDLAAVLGDVSKLDTGITPDGREQIEYIDIALIDPDPNNFYELTAIDELAASIELLGIQQPLRVRDEADKPGRVMIVSGHRRRAALELLVKEGKDKFSSVPCIREANAGSAALQELRLIYANSDTRRLSSAEISKQAERVEALLYQLKEEGMEFPGRMRDHVAEACKVSKSKLARLKVIRDNLEAGIVKKYESGEMNEAVAYAFARQPVEVQREMYDRLCIGANGCKYVSEVAVENFLYRKECLDHKCKKVGGRCTNGARMLDKMYNSKAGYTFCQGRKNACCLDCYDLKSCSASCIHAEEKKAQLKADRKAEIQAEKEKAKREEQEFVDDLTALWSRFEEARKRSRKKYSDIRDHFGYEWIMLEKDFERCAAGIIDCHSRTPFWVSADLSAVRIIKGMADFLGCSVDWLLGRSDEIVPKMDTGPVAWAEGSPTESGLYVMITASEGLEYAADIYRYDAENNAIRYPCADENEDMLCLRYIRLPED